MGLWDGVVHLLGKDNATKASVTTRGAKGAVATEILGSDGTAVTVTGGKLDVNATVTPAAGAATEAKQDDQITQETEINGHVHSIDGKMTACNTGAVVLAAGSAAIGKLAANSGVDIGDVDVTSLPSLAAGTNLIGYTGHGKTIKSVTGTVSADTDIVAAVANKRIKVIAYSLISLSTTSNTITMQSNASAALWTIPLQAITGTIAGANLSVAAPSFLFGTAAGEKLTLDVSAAVNVTYSVSYFDDDAS